MVCSLIDFAPVVLKLLIFKVCGIIGISEMEFFSYSGNERVKREIIKTIIRFLIETNDFNGFLF